MDPILIRAFKLLLFNSKCLGEGGLLKLVFFCCFIATFSAIKCTELSLDESMDF